MTEHKAIPGTLRYVDIPSPVPAIAYEMRAPRTITVPNARCCVCDAQIHEASDLAFYVEDDTVSMTFSCHGASERRTWKSDAIPPAIACFMERAR